jgi:SAM-dependent methyltransferase
MARGRLLGLRGATTTYIHLPRLVAEAAAGVPTGSMVLDAGAGDSPYRHLFGHCTYEAADVCERPEKAYAHVGYVCDLTAIPVHDARYDFVLCTQVLEHVPRPLEVLQEFARVLKPGGRVWLSTPLAYEEHEVPYDFFRYTQYGLRSLFERAGLEVQQLGWVQGYCGAAAHQINFARHTLPRRAADYGGGVVGAATAGIVMLARPLLLGLAAVLAKADLRHRYTGGGYCLDYYVVARKPA